MGVSKKNPDNTDDTGDLHRNPPYPTLPHVSNHPLSVVFLFFLSVYYFTTIYLSLFCSNRDILCSQEVVMKSTITCSKKTYRKFIITHQMSYNTKINLSVTLILYFLSDFDLKRYPLLTTTIPMSKLIFLYYK